VNPGTTLEIARRVNAELFREPRARIFVIGAPAILLIAVRWLFESGPAFSETGMLMIGAFPAFSMLLIGSMCIVRERNRGTLEAIMATPVTRSELVGGYVATAVVLSFFQAVVTVVVAYGICDVRTAAPFWLVGILATLSGVFGMSLGLALSSLAHNEHEASHFIPGLMVPQLLICGAFYPLAKFTGWLRDVEPFLPLAAVTRSMTALRLHEWGGGSALGWPLLAMVLISAAGLAAAVVQIQRQTA
jgi:ABC-2 type transport system permease protein